MNETITTLILAACILGLTAIALIQRRELNALKGTVEFHFLMASINSRKNTVTSADALKAIEKPFTDKLEQSLKDKLVSGGIITPSADSPLIARKDEGCVVDSGLLKRQLDNLSLPVNLHEKGMCDTSRTYNIYVGQDEQAQDIIDKLKAFEEWEGKPKRWFLNAEGEQSPEERKFRDTYGFNDKDTDAKDKA